MIVTVTLNAAIDKRYVVERLSYGTVMRVKECSYTAGGKGLNVSRAARLLGAQVTATGFAGGHAGAYVEEALAECGVRTALTWVPGETRSCINIRDESTGAHTELLEPGVMVPPERQADFLETFRETARRCSAVAISGSVPRGVGIDFYPRLIRIARELGKPVLLDTSGLLLAEGIKARPDFIKPNLDELTELLGARPSGLEEIACAARRLREEGIQNAAVSLGREGALLACEEGVLRGRVPEVEAVNTVGCGDTMTAGFAAGLDRGGSVRDAFRSALAASAANAMYPETGCFLLKDYERLLGCVSVEVFERAAP